MKIKGELFSQQFIPKLIDGTKVRTSRPIKPQPCEESKRFEHWFDGQARFGNNKSSAVCSRKPKYQPGDVMYCRETFYIAPTGDYVYKADGTQPNDFHYWTPSIHMPREAARIFLRVTDVKVQRLEDMTEQDAVEDGFVYTEKLSGKFGYLRRDYALERFQEFWNTQYGTNANWMWVYYLEKISKEEALKVG